MINLGKYMIQEINYSYFRPKYFFKDLILRFFTFNNTHKTYKGINRLYILWSMRLTFVC